MYRRRFYGYGPRYGRRFFRRGYGPGYGYGSGYGAGFGRRRFDGPICDWFPDRPRGWWAMPEYQAELEATGMGAPPAGATWDPYDGKPVSKEAVEYEISLIQKHIEALQKEIEELRDFGKPAK